MMPKQVMSLIGGIEIVPCNQPAKQSHNSHDNNPMIPW